MAITDQMMPDFGIYPGAGKDSGEDFGQGSGRGNREQVTGVSIIGRSHERCGHLFWRKSKTLCITAMEFSFDQEGIQDILAKLFHFIMIGGFSDSIGEGFGQLVEEKCILANIELEVGLRQTAIAQPNDKRMR